MSKDKKVLKFLKNKPIGICKLTKQRKLDDILASRKNEYRIKKV